MFSFFFTKVVSLNVVHSLKIYHNTKFHGPTLTGQILHPPQKFECPPFWNGYSYSIKLRHRGHIQWYDIPTEFHKNLPIASEVDTVGQTHDRIVISLAYFFPFRKESRLKNHTHTHLLLNLYYSKTSLVWNSRDQKKKFSFELWTISKIQNNTKIANDLLEKLVLLISAWYATGCHAITVTNYCFMWCSTDKCDI
jgi:hypothetical protein